MREKPDLQYLSLGALRAQWLCVLAEFFLDRSDLDFFYMMSSEYESVTSNAAVSRASLAFRNLRLIGFDTPARRDAYRAVADGIDWERTTGKSEGYEPPYEIASDHPHTFRRRVPKDDASILRMVGYLSNPIAYQTITMKMAESTDAISVVTDEERGRSVSVDMSPAADLPAPPSHDITRQPKGKITVTFEELLSLARNLDAQDRKTNVLKPGNWEVRLINESGGRKFDILARGNGKLEHQTEINLDGLQHMIGLPGAGKTTLVQLMLVWLDRRGYRATVLLPSIEASLGMIGVLAQYGVSCGLLVGQTPTTRKAHADRLAERIASSSDARGFGVTGAGADMLAINCVLDGMRDGNEAPDEVFPHMKPPCEDLQVRKLKKDGSLGEPRTMMCPVSAWCGRMNAPRSLTERNIWIGHILSTPTRVTPHFLTDPIRLRYFDLIARTMDVVIVDEADGAQSSLDGNAIVELDLTGSPDSMESKIQRDLVAPFVQGLRQHHSSNVTNYYNNTLRFQSFNRSLVSLLQADHFRKEFDGILIEHYQNKFSTGSTAFGAIRHPDNMAHLSETERMALSDDTETLRQWWDAIAMAACQPFDEPLEYDWTHVSGILKRPETEVADASHQMRRMLNEWISATRIQDRSRFSVEIRNVFYSIVEPAYHVQKNEKLKSAHFEMLLALTLVIMQFNILTYAQQAMVVEGVHASPFSSSGVSNDLGRLLPESIVGRLAGVRISLETADDNHQTLRLQYLNFKSAPRMLLYRWHKLHRVEGLDSGPNVLLTSATSFLEDSPSFHIPIGPDYILRRTDEQTDWKNSIWRFSPIPDPAKSGGFLKFSGARGGWAARRQALCQMLDHFYSGDTPLVQRMARDFDEGRKVAFVVNSYEQVRWLKAFLAQRYPTLAKRTIGVIREAPKDSDGDWIVTSQVELIGRRDDWDAIVFPMRALSRGVNIVFPDGPQKYNAALGTVVFLTRPHPSADNLALVAGIAGQRTMALDANEDMRCAPSLMAMMKLFRETRGETLNQINRLLVTPLTMNRLGSMAEPFVADIMIEVLQTIGRAMRNGVRARVLFVDAAWAPRSADGGEDDEISSMLVAIERILQRCISDPDPVTAEIYKAMYEPFAVPLKKCDGLHRAPKRDEKVA
jgi:hypothetical protein